MRMNGKTAKLCLLAGIPLLALPLVAESGMSRDRSHGSNNRDWMNMEEILRGEIFRKDGNEITLRGRHGERITFRITGQTNQLCPKGTSSQSSNASGGSSLSSSSSMRSMSGSSSDNQSQQQGFTFGDCNLQNGDFIKAKVNQNGEATYVRSMGYQSGQGRQGENYFQTGRMGDDYFVLPAGQLGGLDISDKDAHYTVQFSDGEQVGHVYRIMTNQNGDLTYAIVRKNDGQLISVPWQALEGAGNKTFKLDVNKNQLGSLPILEEGENAVQHVQRHWDLSPEDRKHLAKWNDRLDTFYQDRDRFYEDTPTFRDNREGYDRYDRRGSRDRNREASAYDYDYDNSRSGRYPHLGSRPGVAGESGGVSIFGSPSTLPPSEYAPQYEGGDRDRSFDHNRRASVYDYDYDNSRFGRYPHLGSRPGVAGESGGVSIFGSPSTLPPREYAPQYEGGDRDRSFDRNNQRREFYSQSRERNYDDQYQTTTRRSKYEPQREGADQYQARRSDESGYDYRPDAFRP